VLKDFALADGRIVPTPAHWGHEQFDHPGAIPVISANGAKDGVVWLVFAKGRNQGGWSSEAFLHAYDAADVGHELYSAVLPSSVRFAMPAVAGGRVYIGEKGMVYVYGLQAAKKR
jgi:hypothetical protein